MTFPSGRFPITRMRRLRLNPAVRRLVRETALGPSQLVLPLFVRAGEKFRQEIASMPGHYQLSPDLLGDEVRQAADLGLGGVLLFGIPAEKDALGSDAMSDAGIIPQAVRAAKQAVPDLLVITDVCFCEYTDHGHCGALAETAGRVDVDNDATLAMLGRQALAHARAGADVVAPSGMMDGMVGAIRAAVGRGRLRPPADLELRRQVCQRLLRPLPRRGRKRSASSAIAAVTRWTRRPRRARPCGKWSWIWPKGPTW